MPSAAQGVGSLKKIKPELTMKKYFAENWGDWKLLSLRQVRFPKSYFFIIHHDIGAMSVWRFLRCYTVMMSADAFTVTSMEQAMAWRWKEYGMALNTVLCQQTG